MAAKGFIANLKNSLDDFNKILAPKNLPAVGEVAAKILAGKGLDVI